jgi:hypothetical protein
MRKAWKVWLVRCVTAVAFVLFLPALFEAWGWGNHWLTVRLLFAVVIAALCASWLGGMLMLMLGGD